MGLFDHLHEHLFEQRSCLDEASRRQLAEIARQRGVPENVVRELLREGICAGMTLGAAHAGDVKSVVERVLFRQGARAVSLRVSRWLHDEAGHLDIKVINIEDDEGQST